MQEKQQIWVKDVMTERNLKGMREVLGEGTFQEASCKCRGQWSMQSYALGRSQGQKARGTKISYRTNHLSFVVLTRLKLRRNDSEPSIARPKSDIIDPLPVTLLPDRGPLNRLLYKYIQYLGDVRIA